MQQGNAGDYTSYYHHQVPITHNPNSIPNSTELPPSLHHAPPFSSASASAPPYSHYSIPSSDYPQSYTSSYPSYLHNLDHSPPTAPSFAPPPLPPPPTQSQPQIPSFLSTPEVNTYAPLQQQQVSYYSYDTPQSSANYLPPSNQSSLNSTYPSYDSTHQPPATYGPPPVNQSPGLYSSYNGVYETGTGGIDQGGGGGAYSYDDRFGRVGSQDDVFAEGAYRYDGGNSEPYGARGTKSSSSWSGFDDFGRSTSFSSSSQKEQFGSSGKILKAVPKVESQQDTKGGVQKFHVKLLPESSEYSAMNVLCQIGLDGIRMLDPSTNRTLRIYPLETVTRWEGTDSSIYSFWAKSSVDIEPRRIRLQSNKYITNTILDIVAAATVQLKEMGGAYGDGTDRSRGTVDSSKSFEEPTEKKKGVFDWVNSIKPANEEKDHWVPDEAVSKCTSCAADFGPFLRRHHCRNCGDIFCDKCTSSRTPLTTDVEAQPVRVCDRCMTEVTRRLSIARESANKPAVARTHEDLARKLQEEMDKKLKVSSGSKKTSSDGYGKRMREVACPTCTVHLQVELPTSGSVTVECGVCQQPFLVNAP